MHQATFAHDRGDTGRRTPPRSPRRSWVRSRCRCPDRKPPDHCPQCPPTVAVAFPSVEMVGPTDSLPADHPLPRSGSAGATRTPLIAAVVSQRDRLRPVPLPCRVGLTAYTCSGVIAAVAQAWPLLPKASMPHRHALCPFNYTRMYIRITPNVLLTAAAPFGSDYSNSEETHPRQRPSSAPERLDRIYLSNTCSIWPSFF